MTTTVSTLPSAERIGGRIDQRGDAPAIGNQKLHFLCPQGPYVAELPRQRELPEGDLPPVRQPAGQHLQQLLHRLTRRAQRPDNALRLPVEPQRRAGPGIEHRDADRRGVDKGFEVGARTLLAVVGARVGDGQRCLRGEQNHDLFVFGAELPAAFLLADEEVADMLAAAGQRHAHEGPGQQRVGAEPQATHVALRVCGSQGRGKIAQVLEEGRTVRPLHQPEVLVLREADAHEVLHFPRPVNGRDDAVAGGGERAGGFDHLAQDGGEFEALVDAQYRRAKVGDLLARRFVLLTEFLVALWRFTLHALLLQCGYRPSGWWGPQSRRSPDFGLSASGRRTRPSGGRPAHLVTIIHSSGQ